MTLDSWAARLAGRSEAAWWMALNSTEKGATDVHIDRECVCPFPGHAGNWGGPGRSRCGPIRTRPRARGWNKEPLAAPSLLAPSPAPPALPPASQHQKPSHPTLVTQEPHSQNNSSIIPVNSPECHGGVESLDGI